MCDLYSVLLVDDEYLELELLEKQVPWEDLGFQIAATAKNGREGLEVFERLHPDILITDVKMPFVDGIVLAREVRRRYPESRIIFLSGYNQFDYLKAAFQVEAVDYLLKPVDLEELQALMSTVKNKCDQEALKKSKDLLSVLALAQEQKLPYESISLLRNVTQSQMLKMMDEATSAEDADPCLIMVQKVQHYVETHYHEAFSIEALGEQLNYSPNYIRSVFKKYTGETLLEYITNLRMEHAVQLLLDTAVRIRNISYRVGYSNPSYFCSQFYKKFGVTPQQYRSRMQP